MRSYRSRNIAAAEKDGREHCVAGHARVMAAILGFDSCKDREVVIGACQIPAGLHHQVP